MLDQINIPEGLKWASIVFAAGFIGFFGKYLGKLVIGFFQKDKGEKTSQAGHSSQSKSISTQEQELKVAKKSIKTKAKILKKISK
jgi:hypothetical protein